MPVVASRTKRWFKAIGLGCLVIVVVALALPVWFPWILRPVLARFGVGFDSYERVGYARFALTNVRGQFGNARFDSKRIASCLPPGWLWRRYSNPSDDEPLLTVTAWNLQMQPGGISQRTSAPDSAFAVAEEINVNLSAWRTWLPTALLTDGKIQIGSNEVRVASAQWHRGKLTASGESPRPQEAFLLNCDFSGAPPYRVSLEAK